MRLQVCVCVASIRKKEKENKKGALLIVRSAFSMELCYVLFEITCEISVYCKDNNRLCAAVYYFIVWFNALLTLTRAQWHYHYGSAPPRLVIVSSGSTTKTIIIFYFIGLLVSDGHLLFAVHTFVFPYYYTWWWMFKDLDIVCDCNEKRNKYIILMLYFLNRLISFFLIY